MRYGFEWTPGIVLWGMLLILPLATPYLLIRSLRRRLAEPRPAPERSVAVVGVHLSALGKELS
ncbi:MAG TPA: hypothetical protein VF072_01070 [Thermoleophilaceae bacterium]